jgi:prephenate dehydrogenase
MKKAAIIGFGRFGELLAALSVPTFDVTIIESNSERAQAAKTQGYKIAPFASAAKSDFLFLAVPISEIRQTLIKLAPLLHKRHVVMDLCSVKVYPVKLMQKYLPDSQILGAHPMFGPDSAKKGISGLQVALCPVRINPDNLKLIKDFWSGHKLTIIETTPEDHDKDAAYSQAFTYTIAHIIRNMRIPQITFRTRSFDALTNLAALSASNTNQLFHDMLFYNPYFPKMKSEFDAAITQTDVVLAEIKAELG